MQKFILGTLSALLTASLFSVPMAAQVSEKHQEIIHIQIDETKEADAQRLTSFLAKHLTIQNQELKLTAHHYENAEQYAMAKRIIFDINKNAKANNQVFYYGADGEILLKESMPQISTFAFTGKYFWGYTTSFNRKECEKIATYLKIGAGIATIIGILSAKFFVGIPVAAISGLAAAILSIGEAIFKAGGKNRGVDISYTKGGIPIWFNINW